MQIYVDDPLLAVLGNRQQRDRTFAVIIVTWLALGFNLSFAKAARGRSVTWVGACLTILDAG
eukprot:7452811-Heterocapsa_arctica.AAC.1